MNMRRRLSSGDLMLLELVFAIIFFCLSMAASMSVFGNAYEMSATTEARDDAMRETNSAAEIIRSADSEEEIYSLLKENGFSPTSSDVYEKAYDDGKYNIVISLSLSGKLFTADMNCYSVKASASGTEEEPIYSLLIKHALKENRGQEDTE